MGGTNTKWRDRIDLRIATDSKIREYISAKLYEYMEYDYSSHRTSYDTWLFFYKDFSYFIAKGFNRLG